MKFNNTIYDPFSSSFIKYKIRYKDYNDTILYMNFLNRGDKVNVFINLETAIDQLTKIQDLESKIYIKQNFDTIIISNILNLAGHYKKFFASSGLDVKVYLYCTDFSSIPSEFNVSKYNSDYRDYFLNKYNRNPKFALLTDSLIKNVIPDVKTYCDFIPNVYLISAKNIESSCVPMIISECDKSRKNLIITSDVYESQYSFLDNFLVHHITRINNKKALIFRYPDFISYIMRKKTEIENVNYPSYVFLLSTMDDRKRSIYGIDNLGPIGMYKIMTMREDIWTIKQPEIMSGVLEDEGYNVGDDFTNNFYSINIKNQYDELTVGEKSSITNQIVDRIDINSLVSINRTKFYDFPIILENLLC